MRHLLNHTSGLTDYVVAHTENWLAGGKPVTAAWVLNYLSGRPLMFEPGRQWSYDSSSGFYLLGMIVERVSGQTFGQYVRDEIAAPLGLAATAPCDGVFGSAPATRGYGVADSGLVANRLFGAPTSSRTAASVRPLATSRGCPQRSHAATS